MRHTFHTDRKSNPESTPGAFGKRLRLLGAVALLGCTGTAWAAGTPAGTAITNKAALTFSVGGVTQPVINSSPTGNSTTGSAGGENTTFVVDRKVDVLVSEVDNSPTSTVPGASDAPTLFKVKNLGNAVQDFRLAVHAYATGVSMQTATAPADNYATDASAFAVSNCRWAVASADTGPFSGHNNNSSSNYIDELSPDGVRYVQVLCNMPGAGGTPPTSGNPGGDNGQIAVIALGAVAADSACTATGGTTCGTTGTLGTDTEKTPATTADDPNAVDTVFGDAAGAGGLAFGAGQTDIKEDGRHSARDAYKILTAQPKVTKSSAVACDPFNGTTNPKRIPGAIVRYTVSVENEIKTGQTASNVSNLSMSQLTDALNSNLQLVGENYAPARPAACTVAAGAVDAIPSGNTPVRFTCTGSSPARTCPSAAANNATFTAPNLTVNYTTPIEILPAVGTTAAAGELRPGEKVTVEFYVRIK